MKYSKNVTTNYQTNIVKKPWGYEYLVYENELVGLWCLHINPLQSTSMHCHPQKTTGLILLDGIAEISFLADKKVLSAMDKIMIRRGLFHSTKSISKSECILFEIETPKNKQDLIRLDDSYGRISSPYENENSESIKPDNCLWFNSINTHPKNYNFANCDLCVEKINTVDIINKKLDDDLITFLSGGLFKKINGISHNAIISGDVGFGKILKQVSNQMDGVLDETIILTIHKNEN